LCALKSQKEICGCKVDLVQSFVVTCQKYVRLRLSHKRGFIKKRKSPAKEGVAETKRHKMSAAFIRNPKK
jgi:hypothetical protein